MSGSAEQVYQTYRAQGGNDFEAWIIVTQTNTFGAPNANHCRSVRSQYGLTMPVLYDPNGDWVRMMGISTNHYNIVLGPENRIEYKNQSDDFTWRPIIQQLLSQ